MSTFNVTEWCDFVRGVAAPEAEREMRELLASGDAGARRMVDFLTRVMEVGQTDQETRVPGHAERMAKAIATVKGATVEGAPGKGAPGKGAAHKPADSTLWRFLPVEITFDSLLEPAPAGTRDLYPAFRQLAFRAEDFTVDVRLEPNADPGGMAVVGQVLENRGEPRPVARVPVLVTAGGEIVGRSVTSRFGEFHAGELPRGRLDLFVLVGSETCIAVPLEQEADE